MWGRTAFLLLLLCAGPARAWDRDGHRAICMIAWELLAEPARKQTSALLDISTDAQFAETCTWADDIIKERPATAAWHGVSISKDSREIVLARDCKEPGSCVIAQIEKQAAILKSAAPKPERAEALKFLTHLVGDLHQPINIGFTDQRSGRQISGMFHGRPSNLHEVWDTGLLATYVPAGKNAAVAIYNASAWMGRMYGGDRKTPLSWANETLWITAAPPTGYLGNGGGDFFGERYIRQNRQTALEQIDKAGFRLSELLNETWK
jgi:hypothetical protein